MSRHMHEIIGEPNAGKTTVVLASAGNFQRAFPGRGVCYIDMEHTFDPAWAAALGADCGGEARAEGRWLHWYPESSENASDMLRDACKGGCPCTAGRHTDSQASVVIVDSIGSLESEQAFAKEAAKVTVGDNAKVITRMVKHVSTLARLHNVTVLLVNQYRADIGGGGWDVSAGPKAMQHSTTTKVEMRKIGSRDATRKLKFDGDEEPVSCQSRARVTRMKYGPPGRVAEFFINNRPTEEFGPAGIDFADELATLGKRTGAIPLSGSHYDIPGGRKVNGEAAAIAYLRAHPEACAAVREAIFQEAS
jgi:RecA/RadA recombinase